MTQLLVNELPRQKDRAWRESYLSEQLISSIVIISDVAGLLVASKVVYAIRFGWHEVFQDTYVLVMIAAILLTTLTSHVGRLYDFDNIQSWPRGSSRLAGMATIAAILLITLLYLLKVADDLSRVWLVATFASAVSMMWLTRGLAVAFIRRRVRQGAFLRPVAVFGAGKQGRRFVERAISHGGAAPRRIVGVFDDRRTRLELLPDVPFYGGIPELEAQVRSGLIQEVVVALPWTAEGRILDLVKRLRELPVDVYLGSDLVAHRLPTHSTQIIAGLPAYKVVRLPFSGWDGVVKRMIDVFLGGLLLTLLTPALLVIALAIKLESAGPVLFRQIRYGFNNEPITVYKFRSMRHEPRARFRQASSTDSRITRLGFFLRRNSLDELPQLFNVVRGSMSLVGPRPHPIELNEQFAALIDGYMARHRVKPGITGLAQINGFRGETDTLDKMEARVAHDIRYIESWSLLLDLRILAFTSVKGWWGPNAY